MRRDVPHRDGASLEALGCRDVMRQIRHMIPTWYMICHRPRGKGSTGICAFVILSMIFLPFGEDSCPSTLTTLRDLLHAGWSLLGGLVPMLYGLPASSIIWSLHLVHLVQFTLAVRPEIWADLTDAAGLGPGPRAGGGLEEVVRLACPSHVRFFVVSPSVWLFDRFFIHPRTT